jgi:hypothetical protein
MAYRISAGGGGTSRYHLVVEMMLQLTDMARLWMHRRNSTFTL